MLQHDTFVGMLTNYTLPTIVMEMAKTHTSQRKLFILFLFEEYYL